MCFFYNNKFIPGSPWLVPNQVNWMSIRFYVWKAYVFEMLTNHDFLQPLIRTYSLHRYVT